MVRKNKPLFWLICQVYDPPEGIRDDIQNARRIIGKGLGGLTRLWEALESGAIVPALGALIFAELLE